MLLGNAALHHQCIYGYETSNVVFKTEIDSDIMIKRISQLSYGTLVALLLPRGLTALNEIHRLEINNITHCVYCCLQIILERCVYYSYNTVKGDTNSI